MIANKKTPIFSVVLPTRNRPEMMLRAVESVSKQTFTSYELIIVDDASDYDISKIQFPKNINNFRLIKNKRNVGAAASRNAGIEAAGGKYISFLDDDDEFMPDFLSRTFDKLDGSKPEVGLSCSGVNYIDYIQVGNEIKTKLRPRPLKLSCNSKLELFIEFLSIGTGFGITLKKECIENVGYLDTSLKIVEDTDYFHKILQFGYEPIFLEEIQIIMHNHNQERLSSLATHATRIDECKLIVERYKILYCQYPKLEAQLKHHINNLEQELEDSYKNTKE